MLFLTGPHGAGKTIAAMFLKKHGFLYIDLGPCLRAIKKCTCPNGTFAEWCLSSEKKFGKQFTDKITASIIDITTAHIRQSDHYFIDAVVVGSRSYTNIDFIRNNTNYSKQNKNSIIIYIDAPIELLRERYNSREGIRLSKNQFRALLNRDLKMGLNQIKKYANYTVKNMDTKSKFLKGIHDIVIDKYSSIYESQCEGLKTHMVAKLYVKNKKTS